MQLNGTSKARLELLAVYDRWEENGEPIRVELLDKFERLILVLGCQRSGTTLAGQILGASSQALLIDESDGLYQWFRAFADGAENAQELLSQSLEMAVVKYNDAITRAAQSKYKTNKAVRCLILKAPNLTYEFRSILDLETQVSIVFPVRDPRAVVASMMRLDHVDFIGNQLKLLRQHEEEDGIADYITKLVDNDLAYDVRLAYLWRLKTGFSARYLESSVPTFVYKYEALVKSPNRVCAQMTKALGLSLNPAMLRHETIYRGWAQGRTNRRRAIDSDSLDIWSGQLTKRQQDRIMDISEPVSSKLGYK